MYRNKKLIPNPFHPPTAPYHSVGLSALPSVFPGSTSTVLNAVFEKTKRKRHNSESNQTSLSRNRMIYVRVVQYDCLADYSVLLYDTLIPSNMFKPSRIETNMNTILKPFWFYGSSQNLCKANGSWIYCLGYIIPMQAEPYFIKLTKNTE